MKANPISVLRRAQAVINSCKTNGQLRMAETYAYFAMRSAFEPENCIPVFGECYQPDRRKWQLRLTQSCIDKQAEFLWETK